MFNGAAAAVEHDVTLKDAYTMLNNLDNFFNTYDLMERLGCDTYNGEVYIDYYPKEWQGVAEKPAVSVNGYSNGYFKILPSKLLYSYDNQEWQYGLRGYRRRARILRSSGGYRRSQIRLGVRRVCKFAVQRRR